MSDDDLLAVAQAVISSQQAHSDGLFEMPLDDADGADALDGPYAGGAPAPPAASANVPTWESGAVVDDDADDAEAEDEIWRAMPRAQLKKKKVVRRRRRFRPRPFRDRARADNIPLINAARLPRPG